MDKTKQLLEAGGAQVHDVAFPSSLDDGDRLKHICKVIVCCEARKAFLREYRGDKEKLGEDIRALVENKANFTNGDFLEAFHYLAAMRRVVDELAGEYSVILTPSAIDEAPIGLGDMGSPAFNIVWTVC